MLSSVKSNLRKAKILAALLAVIILITTLPALGTKAANSVYLKAYAIGEVNFRSSPSGSVIAKVVSDLVYVDVNSNNGGFYAARYQGRNGYISRAYVELYSKNFNVGGDYSYYVGDTQYSAKAGDVLSFYVDDSGRFLRKNNFQIVSLPAGTGMLTVPVSTYTTYYQNVASQANRGYNIQLGAARIQTEVKPGAEFNWIRTLGPISGGAGYKTAAVYVNKQVVQGIGGGLCQVSTTLYNAVLAGNFTVTEVHHHGLPVHYVDWDNGRDATITNTVNFRWVNNRANSVYVKTYTGTAIKGGESLGYLTIDICEVI